MFDTGGRFVEFIWVPREQQHWYCPFDRSSLGYPNYVHLMSSQKRCLWPGAAKRAVSGCDLGGGLKQTGGVVWIGLQLAKVWHGCCWVRSLVFIRYYDDYN